MKVWDAVSNNAGKVLLPALGATVSLLEVAHDAVVQSSYEAMCSNDAPGDTNLLAGPVVPLAFAGVTATAAIAKAVYDCRGRRPPAGPSSVIPQAASASQAIEEPSCWKRAFCCNRRGAVTSTGARIPDLYRDSSPGNYFGTSQTTR